MNKFFESVALRKEAGAYNKLTATLSRAARKGKIKPEAINRLADQAYDDRLIRAMNTRLNRARQSTINHGKNADRLLDLMAAKPAIKQSRGDDALTMLTNRLRTVKDKAYESVYHNPNAYYDGDWFGDKVLNLIGQRSAGNSGHIVNLMDARRSALSRLRDVRDHLRESADDVWNIYKDAPKYK